MTHASILIPQRNQADAVARQLPGLWQTLAELGRPSEVVVVDDGSDRPEIQKLRDLLDQHANLRVLCLEKPTGLDAALTAGIAAARGEAIVTLAAGDVYPSERILDLMAQLVRADLVFGRPRHRGWAKAWRRVARIPRWLLLGLEVREPECLFWAARREALLGLELPRGMYRYLPTLVATRGYRVAEIPVDLPGPRFARQPASRDSLANPGDLLAAWWLTRRWRNYTVQELTGTAAAAGTTANRDESAEYRLPMHSPKNNLRHRKSA